MTVTVSATKLADRELLEGAAVLYPVARRIVEYAADWNEQAARYVNSTLFCPASDRLLGNAEFMHDTGENSAALLPGLLDRLRNAGLNALSDFGVPSENEIARSESLTTAKDIITRIESIFEALVPLNYHPKRSLERAA